MFTRLKKALRELFPRATPSSWGWARTAEEEFGKGNFVFVDRVYARQEDMITCENGHAVALFRRAVGVGEKFDHTAIHRWYQPEPKIGTIDQRCIYCGARWFKGAYFHFSDGWRIGRHGGTL